MAFSLRLLHNKFLLRFTKKQNGGQNAPAGWLVEAALPRSRVNSHDVLLQSTNGTIDCCGWAGKPGPKWQHWLPVPSFFGLFCPASMTKGSLIGGITGDPPVAFHHSRCTVEWHKAALDYDCALWTRRWPPSFQIFLYCWANCTTRNHRWVLQIRQRVLYVKPAWYRGQRSIAKMPALGARPQPSLFCPFHTVSIKRLPRLAFWMWRINGGRSHPLQWRDSSHKKVANNLSRPLQLLLHKTLCEKQHGRQS